MENQATAGTDQQVGIQTQDNAAEGNQQQTAQAEPQAKPYTQDQLDAMFKERAERATRSTLQGIFDAYGVKTREELDALVAEGKKAPEYQEALKQSAKGQVNAAFAVAGIPDSMREEVEYYFKGRGLEITEQSLKEELGKHPHWKPAQAEAPTNPQPQPQAQPSPTQGAAQQPRQGVTVTAIGSVPQDKDAEYLARRDKFLAAAGVRRKQ